MARQRPTKTRGRGLAVAVTIGGALAASFAMRAMRPDGRSAAVLDRAPQSVTLASEPVSGFEVVRTLPHDPDAFTQGLVALDGVFYESTGLNGRSSLRRVEIATGRVLQRRDVDRRYFAEGLTHWEGRLIQLTWDTNVAFVYDRASFELLRTFAYPGEGWGLTQDGRHLVMSDGTSRLRFLDPVTFAEVRRLTVTSTAGPVTQLNELEFVRGEILANVWLTDRIARIAPDTGRVTGWIDLAGLAPRRDPTGNAVLNGIAYDAAGDRLFVTGKLWPQVYEIRLRPPR